MCGVIMFTGVCTVHWTKCNYTNEKMRKKIAKAPLRARVSDQSVSAQDETFQVFDWSFGIFMYLVIICG